MAFSPVTLAAALLPAAAALRPHARTELLRAHASDAYSAKTLGDLAVALLADGNLLHELPSADDLLHRWSDA